MQTDLLQTIAAKGADGGVGAIQRDGRCAGRITVNVKPPDRGWRSKIENVGDLNAGDRVVGDVQTEDGAIRDVRTVDRSGGQIADQISYEAP